MKLYRIKKSNIDKKGKGLYAAKDIKKKSPRKHSKNNRNQYHN